MSAVLQTEQIQVRWTEPGGQINSGKVQHMASSNLVNPELGAPANGLATALVAAITNRQSPPDKLRRPYLGSRPIIQKAICPWPFAKQTRRRNPFSPHPRVCFGGLGL